MDVQIYAVFATDTDRDRLLGHATGAMADIEAYFEDNQGYGLRLERVQIVNVPSGFAGKAYALREQREALERQISEINKQLNVSR